MKYRPKTCTGVSRTKSPASKTNMRIRSRQKKYSDFLITSNTSSGSSPMTGIGNNHQIASLSNCFVIGLDGQADSYGGIIRIDEEQVQLMKRRGGVGHDLSHIRPKGSPVKNSA